MAKFFEASAVLTFSLVITAAVVVALLPLHPRSMAEASESAGVVHAVSTSAAQNRAAESGCPYLAAIAASSACPAAPMAVEPGGCPFLDRQRAEEPPKRERKLTGQHT